MNSSNGHDFLLQKFQSKNIQPILNTYVLLYIMSFRLRYIEIFTHVQPRMKSKGHSSTLKAPSRSIAFGALSCETYCND